VAGHQHSQGWLSFGHVFGRGVYGQTRAMGTGEPLSLFAVREMRLTLAPMLVCTEQNLPRLLRASHLNRIGWIGRASRSCHRLSCLAPCR